MALPRSLRLFTPTPTPTRCLRVYLQLERLEPIEVPAAIASAVYPLLVERANENATAAFVYRDADSAFNLGIPSGLFGSISKLAVDVGAIDDPTNPTTGTTSDPNRIDRTRGNVTRLTFSPLAAGEFVGLNFVQHGAGFDLRGATNLVLDVRTPTAGGMRVQFGVGGKTTQFIAFQQSAAYQTVTIPLSSLGLTAADLASVTNLFSVGTNVQNAAAGGTLLIDNVRLDPVPPAVAGLPSLPLSNTTFGVVPQSVAPIPFDQLVRNVATVYEASMALLVLTDRGTAAELAAARRIADGLVYALARDNRGLPLPAAPDGSTGVHDAYFGGFLPLPADQPGGAQAGDSRLAGFSASGLSPTGFALVLDGASGGNNAFAMMALTRAFQRLGDARYLAAARTIGHWIAGNLTDTSGTGFGGYYVGYPDQGQAKVLLRGKSVENNADIAAAYYMLATVERQLGNPAAATVWEARGHTGGDFVMAMFDPAAGRFYAGTAPAGASGPGVTLNGPQRGADVTNTFDFVDANTFTTLALAGHPRYRGQIDWRRPALYATQFVQTVSANGRTFTGYSLVRTPVSGANGVAWEFTGQVAATLEYVGRLYRDPQLIARAAAILPEIDRARQFAPFADGRGLVAATVPNGESVPLLSQGIQTPFQFIGERVGLAASTWAVVADTGRNPFVLSDRRVAVGADAGGGPHVKVFNTDGVQVRSFFAYDAGFTGGVRVAVGDLTGDGIDDVVTAAGAGGGPHVKVFDGATGATVQSFFAYAPQFTGGVFLAVGDVTGDGVPDVITGAGAGGGPHVKVFDGRSGATVQSFFAYAPQFTGGITVAAGDVNGDRVDDIVTGTGAGGGPHVKVFSGVNTAELRSFFAFAPTFLGGIAVAAGDVNGDGLADIVTAAGPGGGPHVKAFSGSNTAEVASFFATAGTFTGGVRLGTTDSDDDGAAEILTTLGAGGLPALDLWTVSPFGSRRIADAFDPAFRGGVFVAG